MGRYDSLLETNQKPPRPATAPSLPRQGEETSTLPVPKQGQSTDNPVNQSGSQSTSQSTSRPCMQSVTLMRRTSTNVVPPLTCSVHLLSRGAAREPPQKRLRKPVRHVPRAVHAGFTQTLSRTRRVFCRARAGTAGSQRTQKSLPTPVGVQIAVHKECAYETPTWSTAKRKTMSSAAGGTSLLAARGRGSGGIPRAATAVGPAPQGARPSRAGGEVQDASDEANRAVSPTTPAQAGKGADVR